MTGYKKASRSSGIVAFLLLALSVAAPAEDIKNLSTIKNFGRIADHYYRGAQPEGQDYVDLAALGIRTVINLTSDDAEADEKSLVENAGMNYYQIPMTTHQPPTTTQLTEFLRLVNDPASQPVYVHCVGGRHRTGLMTAVYRMTQGWDADQAYKEMKQYDFGPSFLHPEFKSFVFEYYNGLTQTKTAPAQAVVSTKAGN
ncbi:dual specificity protein phosphatase family protein [bacterium]|nr:dual specificity protein phosphatase family protein [bacterium]MCI0601433.1 dual specificity protein phosphatase family protein [bacterium]